MELNIKSFRGGNKMKIVCTNVGREPSKSCYKECIIAYKCGALKQWEKENNNSTIQENNQYKFEITKHSWFFFPF